MSARRPTLRTAGGPPRDRGVRALGLSVWRILGNPHLLLALRVILGLTFIFSAAGKLPHQAEFVGVVQAHGLLPSILADAYGYALPWLELLVGILLLAGLFTRVAAGVTLLMVVSFLVANGTAVYGQERVHDTACSCFRWITVRTGDALIIDIVMVVFAVLLLLHAQGRFSLDRTLRRFYGLDADVPAEEQPPRAPATPPTGRRS